jgi:hypothetical protein
VLQVIEESFILDTLTNYITYRPTESKEDRDEPRYDKKERRVFVQFICRDAPASVLSGPTASSFIDPKTQIVQGKTVCVVSCQRSPEPVFLKWKGMETSPDGDFYVRSGPGSVRLAPDSAEQYIQTRFPSASKTSDK